MVAALSKYLSLVPSTDIVAIGEPIKSLGLESWGSPKKEVKVSSDRCEPEEMCNFTVRLVSNHRGNWEFVRAAELQSCRAVSLGQHVAFLHICIAHACMCLHKCPPSEKSLLKWVLTGERAVSD